MIFQVSDCYSLAIGDSFWNYVSRFQKRNKKETVNLFLTFL